MTIQEMKKLVDKNRIKWQHRADLERMKRECGSPDFSEFMLGRATGFAKAMTTVKDWVLKLESGGTVDEEDTV